MQLIIPSISINHININNWYHFMSTILFHSINIKSYSYSLFVNATPAGFVLICILTFELRESLELMRNLAIIIWCNERAKCGGGPPPDAIVLICIRFLCHLHVICISTVQFGDYSAAKSHLLNRSPTAILTLTNSLFTLMIYSFRYRHHLN